MLLTFSPDVSGIVLSIKLLFSSDLQNGRKIQFWSMSGLKGSRVALALKIHVISSFLLLGMFFVWGLLL